MKETNIKKDKCQYEEIAFRSQDIHQCENYYVSLHKIGKAVVYTENNCAYATEYVLDKSEKAEAIDDPDAFIEDLAAEWASNCDNHSVERIAWGLDDPNDLAIDDCSDFNIDVEVIKIENYAGYYPVSSLGVYGNFVAAKKAIEEDCPDGTYYLANGEIERPSYYIIEA